MDKIGLPVKQDQRLKALLKGIGEGVVVVDRDLRILWANPVVESWTGGLEEITGLRCYEVLRNEKSPCEGCPSLRSFRTAKVEKTGLHAYRLKGNEKSFSLTASPLLDEEGNVAAVAEVAHDLSGSIELESTLKEGKEQLQAIFDGIGDGISVIDRGFNVRRVNRGILEIYNKNKFSDVIDRKCYTEYYGEDKVCGDCPALSTFENGTTNHLTKVRRKGKEYHRAFDIYTFPITDRSGAVVQVIEYFRDISDRVRLEERILRYERMAGAGELAIGIAHELRNPLANINASAQFCMGMHQANEQLKKHLRVMLRNSGNANRIITDLLDFAKPDEVVLKPGHIEKVIKRACSLVKGRLSKHHVRLIKRVPQRLPKVLIDAKRLEGAILNLILNALDALPEGGRFIVAAYLDNIENEVAVTFTDTGEGISEENIFRIFDPFFTTKKSGLGLGLSISHNIIDNHKGKIKIKSELGKGTEVTVRLPAYDEG